MSLIFIQHTLCSQVLNGAIFDSLKRSGWSNSSAWRLTGIYFFVLSLSLCPSPSGLALTSTPDISLSHTPTPSLSRFLSPRQSVGVLLLYLSSASPCSCSRTIAPTEASRSSRTRRQPPTRRPPKQRYSERVVNPAPWLQSRSSPPPVRGRCVLHVSVCVLIDTHTSTLSHETHALSLWFTHTQQTRLFLTC